MPKSMFQQPITSISTLTLEDMEKIKAFKFGSPDPDPYYDPHNRQEKFNTNTSRRLLDEKYVYSPKDSSDKRQLRTLLKHLPDEQRERIKAALRPLRDQAEVRGEYYLQIPEGLFYDLVNRRYPKHFVEQGKYPDNYIRNCEKLAREEEEKRIAREHNDKVADRICQGYGSAVKRIIMERMMAVEIASPYGKWHMPDKDRGRG